jgi:hypothetical protein
MSVPNDTFVKGRIVHTARRVRTRNENVGKQESLAELQEIKREGGPETADRPFAREMIDGVRDGTTKRW